MDNTSTNEACSTEQIQEFRRHDRLIEEDLPRARWGDASKIRSLGYRLWWVRHHQAQVLGGEAGFFRWLQRRHGIGRSEGKAYLRCTGFKNK